MLPRQLLLPKLFLLFLPLVFLPAAHSDLAADRAALLRLQAAVGGRTRGWNNTAPSPCAWEGVACNATTNRVVSLRLPGDGLSGRIPEGTIGSLSELRNLSLRRNLLSGSIPSDLGSCVNLEYLYLQENRFSGVIPNGVFGLRNLFRLNLSNNNFSGVIPVGFNNLTSLRALHLQNNRFIGPIPELDGLLNLRDFNVSLNGLSGSIPSSLRRFSSESFFGNLLCDRPLGACESRLSGGAIAGIAIASSVGFILFLLLVLFMWKRCSSGPSNKLASNVFSRPKPFIGRDGRHGPSGPAIGGGGDGGGIVFVGERVEVFSLDDLLRASAEVLGKGNVGTTYKAFVGTGKYFVVKRVKNVNVSEQEFGARIEELGAMKHANLVPVVGYFFGKDEKLMLFESMPLGSLHSVLHGSRGANRESLTWEVRAKIALSAATGLEYLHSLAWDMSHGNIKSSNIFLKHNYEACVSEYCITRLVAPLPLSDLMGYKAPEVVESHRVSQKADVYSFGVLVLELLTGKEPMKDVEEEGIELPGWVKSVVQEKWTIEVFDPQLLKHQDSSEEQMVQLLHLAISCTSQYPHKRPSMEEVTKRIKEISRVPYSV